MPGSHRDAREPQNWEPRKLPRDAWNGEPQLTADLKRHQTPTFAPLDKLVELLGLETLDRDRFRGDPGRGEGRLFGGTVAAQSVMAAGLTVEPDRELHSIHAYFLRPGSHEAPIRFVVDRIRDGRSFTTRRVTAHQAGEVIFNLSASFKVPESGIEHQSEMPEAPDPESVENWEDMRARLLGDESERRRESALEVRMVDPVSIEPSPDGRASQRVWMRLRGEIPDNPLLRTALLVYASDRTLLSTAVRPHGVHWGRGMAASLDHAMWIHRPFCLDDWFLYASESPVAFAARGLCLGGFFTRDGIRIASVAQEALIRINT